jgi:pimeloyl-ACP methyl ester carboxylesterase
MSGTDFREGYVEADGVRIRYLEAGQGVPLVHLHGAGGPRLTPAHDLLARHFRVVVFEMPGFGQSPESTRTQSMAELASMMAQAVSKIGVDGFSLLGTSFGGETALWLALQAPERVLALVLEAPGAIRQDGADLKARLEELATPTLVLFGTRDTVIPPATGRAYKELIPNCHLVFVYDAGHAISADRPEAFTEVVVDFLERHEAFVISRTPTVINP